MNQVIVSAEESTVIISQEPATQVSVAPKPPVRVSVSRPQVVVIGLNGLTPGSLVLDF